MRPDTKAIRARADAATAGPWRTRRRALTHDLTSGLIGNLVTVASFPFDPGEEASAIRDADFCAESRDDVPALCSRAEELEAALAATLLALRTARGFKGRPELATSAESKQMDEAEAMAEGVLEGES